MSQWSRVLAALEEDPGPVPSTLWWLTTTCKSSFRDPMPSSGLRHQAHTCSTQIYADKIPMYIKSLKWSVASF